jgi:hypothetical protein
MVQRMLVRLLLAISIALIAFSVYAVYWAWNAEKLPDNQLEIVKVAIQFLLITGVGGVTIWTLNYLNERRREQEHKIQEQITSMHVLLSTISELYRSIKRTKRIMRSRSNWCQADKDIVVCKQDDFMDLMDEVQDIQVRMEMLRDDVSAREYIFPAGMSKILEKELHYVARYLHDVFEEYERGKVQFEDGRALIGANCDNLKDFIYQRRMPQELSSAIETFTKAERSGDLSVTERREYLRRISEIRDALGRQRYAGVASALVYLAMSHIKEAAGTRARARP